MYTEFDADATFMERYATTILVALLTVIAIVVVTEINSSLLTRVQEITTTITSR